MEHRDDRMILENIPVVPNRTGLKSAYSPEEESEQDYGSLRNYSTNMAENAMNIKNFTDQSVYS